MRRERATELTGRDVPVQQELLFQLGQCIPDARTTGRYIKFDERCLANAKTAIGEYLHELNEVTECNVLGLHSSKILPKAEEEIAEFWNADLEIPSDFRELGMVGGTRIELVTPTMST